jgi:hypothetical protein
MFVLSLLAENTREFEILTRPKRFRLAYAPFAAGSTRDMLHRANAGLRPRRG